jgi:phosphoribosylglycinamide formyltransferase 2
MVTLVSQTLTEFDLHARAILGLPIPEINLLGASASAVVLADRDAEHFSITGLADALALSTSDTHVDARIFGKPVTRPYRRMAVTLARVEDGDVNAAKDVAIAAAAMIKICYGDAP